MSVGVKKKTENNGSYHAQSVWITLPFQDVGAGDDERNKIANFNKSVIATFMNGVDESILPQVRKMVFFEVFVVNI